ncbi:MAG: hypothetical protein GXC73_11905 [Chitinophagaceae bacterium]|nr:hypothetical protein [Chitinophagaceae bacterium]
MTSSFYPFRISYKHVLQVCCIVFLPFVLVAQKQNNRQQTLPVTKHSYNDDSTKIQFAIISDLWGGLRPGIFEDAVDKLQLLQPQFVISVGDLIDGKSYDPLEINRQWNVFDQAIKPLSMPFYYVPGNHDIGNAVMENEWKKRLGSPYYHFVYRNALFLCINTEDGGKGGIRDEQVAYFKKAIADNADVRWTFLFMHRPVWQGKEDRQEGYEKIEAMLKDRKYTLFSGHHHTYLGVTKNGNRHYVLGSTGGGSDLRGEKFGEFDHVTWVTLTNDTPKIVNLKLEGIIKDDVVNEQTHPLTQTLINEQWLIPVPFVAEKQFEQKITATIEFSNPTNYPLKISGNTSKHVKGYKISPETIELVIAPKSKQQQQVIITKADQSFIDMKSLTEIEIELTGEYTRNNITYALPAKKKLLLSWKLVAEKLKEQNGNMPNLFHGRDTAGMIYVTAPEQLNGPWYWSGATDGLLRFKLSYDNKFAYFVIVASDNEWMNETAIVKDMIYLHVEDGNGKENRISFSPWDIAKVEGAGSVTGKDIESRKIFADNILFMELKIPLNKIQKADHSIRMNIGFRDYDRTPEKWVSTLFWKPEWNSSGNYQFSGTFIINR